MVKKVNVGFQGKYKISKWLEDHKTELIAERPTYTALATRIKGELEISIGAEALKDLCIFIGVVWEPKSLYGGAGAAKIREEVNSLKEELTILKSEKEDREKYLINLRAEHDRKLLDLQCQVDQMKSEIQGLHIAHLSLRGAFNYVARNLDVKIPNWEIPPAGRINSTVAGK